MILVTGGTGLVGSHLLLLLAKQGKKVRAIYRNYASLKKCKDVFEANKSLSLFDSIEWVEADLLDYFSLKDQMQGVNFVYHSAAQVSFDNAAKESLMKINVEGTANMVNLALEFNVRKFCYVSSVSALGEDPKGICTNESTPWQNTKETSNYSISKYYAENEVWRGSEEGLEVVIVNPGTIIGYGNWDESSLKIIKKINEGLSFYPSGSNGFVGVQDVVRGMTMLMDSDIKNKRYVLVSENWTFKKLFDTIAEALNKKKPIYKASRNMAIGVLLLDQVKAFFKAKAPVLTKETLLTSFKEQCYNSDAIKSELGFEFESLEKVIQESCVLYLAGDS